METLSDNAIRWIIVLLVAIVQIGSAFYAANALAQDPLSIGPCRTVYVGGQANLFILPAVLIWMIVLAVKSRGATKWHEGIQHLAVLAVTSTLALAVIIGTTLRYCSA